MNSALADHQCPRCHGSAVVSITPTRITTDCETCGYRSAESVPVRPKPKPSLPDCPKCVNNHRVIRVEDFFHCEACGWSGDWDGGQDRNRTSGKRIKVGTHCTIIDPARTVSLGRNISVDLEVFRCFQDDTRRGTPGGSGGSSGKSRKRQPNKRIEVRYEQDSPIASDPQVTTTTRLESRTSRLQVGMNLSEKYWLEHESMMRKVSLTGFIEHILGQWDGELLENFPRERRLETWVQMRTFIGPANWLKRQAGKLQVSVGQFVMGIVDAHVAGWYDEDKASAWMIGSGE